MDFDNISWIAVLVIGRWIWKSLKKKKQQETYADPHSSKNEEHVNNQPRKTKRELTDIFKDLNSEISERGKEFVDELKETRSESDATLTHKKRGYAREMSEKVESKEYVKREGGIDVQRSNLQNSQVVPTRKKKDEYLLENEEDKSFNYGKKVQKRARLELLFNKNAVVTGVIMAEVLGKPKAL
ncbi:MAG: hypothetical protein LR001_07680 [Clostridiales bacterium]|nr:hypothetical protein [Clostridiales bacterium]